MSGPALEHGVSSQVQRCELVTCKDHQTCGTDWQLSNGWVITVAIRQSTLRMRHIYLDLHELMLKLSTFLYM